jgi:hypothetical protein
MAILQERSQRSTTSEPWRRLQQPVRATGPARSTQRGDWFQSATVGPESGQSGGNSAGTKPIGEYAWRVSQSEVGVPGAYAHVQTSRGRFLRGHGRRRTGCQPERIPPVDSQICRNEAN